MMEPTPQTPRRYVCPRVPSGAGVFEIDGRLDKPVWSRVPWTGWFVDIEGDAKPAPRHATRVKMAWDDECLYVGASMDEPHVWATLTRRDSIVYHDNDFEVFLNPTGDSHNYYELEVNALNTIFDLFLPRPYRDGGPADHAYDVRGLRSAAWIDGTLNDPRDVDRGWSVEIAWPWRAMDRHGQGSGEPPRVGDQWRVNFSRVQWRTRVTPDGRYEKAAGVAEDNWVWSPQGVVDMHRPEQWGIVQFGNDADDAFVPDASLPARAALHRVYYAQRRFHAIHGRWGDAGEIGPSIVGVELVARDGGWIARTPISVRGEGPEAGRPGRGAWCCIREDSRVWVE